MLDSKAPRRLNPDNLRYRTDLARLTQHVFGRYLNAYSNCDRSSSSTQSYATFAQ